MSVTSSFVVWMLFFSPFLLNRKKNLVGDSANDRILVWARSGRKETYRVPTEPHPFDRISHQTQPRSVQLLHHTDITLHVQKRDGQQRPILLQSPNHALLALGHEEEALRPNARHGRHGTLDFLLGDQFQRAAGFRAVGLGHDGDDGEDEDVAEGREVGSAEQGRADADEVLAFVGMFGDFEGDGSDAGYNFGG